jgi:hypothetical protein
MPYIYDYRNRITAAGVNSATSTYAYDFQDNRVQQTYSGATTTYANRLYSIVSKTTGANVNATSTDLSIGRVADASHLPCNARETCLALAFLQGTSSGTAAWNISKQPSTLRTPPRAACSATAIGLHAYILTAP